MSLVRLLISDRGDLVGAKECGTKAAAEEKKAQEVAALLQDKSRLHNSISLRKKYPIYPAWDGHETSGPSLANTQGGQA